MKKKTLIELLQEVYLAGFMASGEGNNGEYPYGNKNESPEENENWKRYRDEDINKVVKEQIK